MRMDPEIFLTLDPGWKKFGSGINLPDPDPLVRGTDPGTVPDPSLLS